MLMGPIYFLCGLHLYAERSLNHASHDGWEALATIIHVDYLSMHFRVICSQTANRNLIVNPTVT